MSPVLEVRGLRTEFPLQTGRVPVVDDVDLSVEAGEVLALVGESGCGKSITALSILRLVPRPGRIVSGRVLLAGREIQALPVTAMRRVRGHEIAMIFQEPMTSLNPVVSVGDQVVEAIRLHDKVSVAAARERTRGLFGRVGIPDPGARLRSYPHELSGGLKQRVMIAMALATRPKLLIADEPTTALDVTIQAQILELLRSLQRDLQMAILLITHDLGIVNQLAARVAVMYAGRIVETGPRREILAAPRHPYTAGLLSCIPVTSAPRARLDEIPGVVPPPSDWPLGCRFSNRCSRVLEVCRSRSPGATDLAQDHRVWCHAVEEEVES
ncbi:MAG: ABC transporter ATP-binding protein [Myxococcota bacterium]